MKKTNALERLAALQAEQEKSSKNSVNLREVRELKKRVKDVISESKISLKQLEKQQAIKKAKTAPARTTRARTVAKEKVSLYTQGKYVNKGIDEARQPLEPDEIEYLKNQLSKVKQVDKVTYDQLRYLITSLFFEKLKSIKEGRSKSTMHKEYMARRGKCMSDLFSKIKTTLFTNEQRDYINGSLQGAFDAVSLDVNGEIKHSDIDYLSTVLFYEVTIMIVQHVLKFDTQVKAINFMSKHTTETFNCSV